MVLFSFFFRLIVHPSLRSATIALQFTHYTCQQFIWRHLALLLGDSKYLTYYLHLTSSLCCLRVSGIYSLLNDVPWLLHGWNNQESILLRALNDFTTSTICS
jgi:hypothetical protein